MSELVNDALCLPARLLTSLPPSLSVARISTFAGHQR